MSERIYIILAIIIAVVASFAYFREAEAPTDHIRENQPVKSQKAVVQAHIGESASAIGVIIKPFEIIEDSRCPVDVTCIQAGTVRIKAVLSGELGAVNQEFQLNTPITTENEKIVLIKVLPTRSSKEQLEPGDYLFIFEITKK